MATIGTISCISSDMNTGLGRCPWNIGLIQLPIAIPKGARFSNTDISDIATYLKGKFFNDSAALAWYPLPILVELTDGTTEAGTETFGYGNSARVGKDFPVWTGRYRGGQCAYNAARKFHGKAEQYDWLFMDSEGRLIGRQREISGTLYVYGFDTDDVYVRMWQPPSNSNEPIYNIEWRFSDVSQFADNMIAVETGLTPADFKGLISLTLTKIAEAADGVYTIKVETQCGKENIGERYNAELDAAGMWVANNATTGGAITVTGVTYNSTLGALVVNLEENDADYPTVGDDIYINLAAPSVLENAGVGDFDTGEGYKGIRITVQAT